MEAASGPDPRRHWLLVAALALGPATAAQACDDDHASPASAEDAAAEAPAADAAPPRGRERLSQTGLYSDIERKTIAADARAYRPMFALWSDGAEKNRWIRLPAGTSIDTSDPDHWVFPVGTQLFKEFTLDGKRLETRLVERIAATGDREIDYWLGAFRWREDESDADFVREGALDVRGTRHDVPSAEACWTCHVGEPGHVLGFSALQLSHDRGGLSLATLRAERLLSTAVADTAIPGDPTAQGAIGWLHANCGHCHNPSGTSWPDTDMVLRYAYGEASLAGSRMYASTVGARPRSFSKPGITARIAPGDPEASSVAYRISTREDGGAMPPIATELVDPDGVNRVRTWIASLPRDAGAD